MALDFPNSPATGQQFTGPNGIVWQWDGTKWIVSGGGTVFQSITGDVGRNLLHNGLFNVAQRGAGPFTAFFVYTLDRWVTGGSTDTIGFQQYAASDADRAAIGDEACQLFLANPFTGNAAAGAYNEIQQRIENVRRLAGKTVTLSFWAAASAALRLGINATQHFGSGGSPSADVNVLTTGIAVTLSGTWTRYTATIAIPSVAGKTLGTNGDSYTIIRIGYSSGANANAFFGNIGAQTGAINIWGVQLEIGSVATPLEKLDPQQDLAKCQRFYQGNNAYFSAPVQGAGQIACWAPFGTQMRAAPTIVFGTPAYTNASGIGAAQNSIGGFIVYATATAAGPANFNCLYTASADL
jgi:hypothetical protein